MKKEKQKRSAINYIKDKQKKVLENKLKNCIKELFCFKFWLQVLSQALEDLEVQLV